MQLSFNFEENASPSTIAAKLRMQAGIFEGMSAKAAASRKNTDADPEEETTEEAEEDFERKPAKKAAGKKAAAFDDSDDEAEEAPVKKKAAKPKKITIDDVQDACKAHAGENGRLAVVKILKKQFKVDSVQDLDSDDYAAVIEALEL